MIFLQALANDASPAADALDLVDTAEVTLCVSEQSCERFARFSIALKFVPPFPGSMTFVSNHFFVAWRRKRSSSRKFPRSLSIRAILRTNLISILQLP